MASECAVKLSVQQRRFRRHVRDPAVTVGDVPNAATGTFRKARLESLLCVGRQQLSSPCAVRHSRPRNTGDRWRHNPGINVGSTTGAAAVAAGAWIHGNRRLCNFRGWGTVRRARQRCQGHFIARRASGTSAVCCSRPPHAHGGAMAAQLFTTQLEREHRCAQNRRNRRRG